MANRIYMDAVVLVLLAYGLLRGSSREEMPGL